MSSIPVVLSRPGLQTGFCSAGRCNLAKIAENWYLATLFFCRMMIKSVNT